MPQSGSDRFDEEAVLAAARAKCGLADFGEDGFRAGLRALLRSLAAEAGLHEIGAETQRARVVDSLVTRLTLREALRRNPEILEEDLGDPVVIVGLARTGSTMLHRLLASGPDFQAPLWWEVRHPAPFPDSPWRDPSRDPRIPAAREEVRATLEAVPVLAAVHPWDPEGADEEVMLFEHTFHSYVPEGSAHVPAYRAWLDEQDLGPAYAFVKTLLQYLSWQRRQSGRHAGRWVLKAPFHLGYIDPLIRTFPGARVIQTHRDPIETIPSAASFYSALWELHADGVDRREVARQVSERFARALTRCMRAREKQPADRFLDVHYRDVQRDPLAQARRIYDWLGVPFTAKARQVMEAWLADNARDKRPPHRYTLEEFGYTEEGLAAQFAEYRERYVQGRGDSV